MPFLLMPILAINLLTHSLLPCGIAIPWPMAVEPNASLANKISTNLCLCFFSMAPPETNKSTNSSIISFFVLPFRFSEIALLQRKSLIFIKYPPVSDQFGVIKKQTIHIKLNSLFIVKKSGGWDLNPRHPPWQGGILAN